MGQRVAASWPMSYGPPGADRPYDMGEIFELADCVNDQLLLERHYLQRIPGDVATVSGRSGLKRSPSPRTRSMR
jgi:hypothetical protein